jgi:hypothetical protein
MVNLPDVIKRRVYTVNIRVDISTLRQSILQNSAINTTKQRLIETQTKTLTETPVPHVNNTKYAAQIL